MAIVFKRRRAEPSAIYSFRLSFLVLMSLMIVWYLTIQIHDIINEIPSIRVSYDESNSLPMPAVLVTAPIDKQFRLNCTFRDENDAAIIDGSVTNDIEGAGRKYCSNFTHTNTINNKKVVLILPGKDRTISSGTFGFYFRLFSDTRDLNIFRISIFDQTLAPSQENLKIPKTFDSNFIDSLYNLNNYSLPRDNNLVIRISRKLRRAIEPSTFNYFGIPPQLLDEYYITSNFYALYIPNMEVGTYSTFQIYYQNSLTIIEEQFRVKTILSLLGLLGGALSLMLATHALLFGITPLSPWGIVHLLPCISKPTYKKLQVEFDENLLPEDLREDSQEQIIKIQKMINHLNRQSIYLKNCIDTEKLEEFEKKINGILHD